MLDFFDGFRNLRCIARGSVNVLPCKQITNSQLDCCLELFHDNVKKDLVILTSWIVG